MKLKRLLHFIGKPLVLSALISVPFFIYPLVDIGKYKAEIAGVTNIDNNRLTIYEDLDYDGTSERIWIDYPGTHTPVLVSQFEEIIDQWNINGKFKPTHIFFKDVDYDSLMEIIIFTHHSDSLCLNVFNPLTAKIYCEDMMLTPLRRSSFDELDYTINQLLTFDRNADKIKELFFYINGGHSKFPRQLFCYDIDKNVLSISPNACANLVNFECHDLNEDGEYEIYPSKSNAVGNCRLDTAYSDSFCWLMTFCPDLSFSFQPRKIGHFPGTLNYIPIKLKDEFFLMLFYKHDGNIKKQYHFLELADLTGKPIFHKRIKRTFNLEECVYLITPPDHKNAYIFFKDTMHRVNLKENQLTLEAVRPLEVHRKRTYREIDLDDDGEVEYIFSSKFGNELVITDANFENESRVELLDNDFIQHYSIRRKQGERSQLFFRGAHKSYFINYYENPNYLLKFAYYPSVYLLILAIIWLLAKSQEQRIKQRNLSKKRVSELQLKAAINQMEPHFTLNIIESLNSLFDKQDKKRAVHAFSHFSQMLRNTLVNSDKIGISLRDELDHIESYLELMKFRHNYCFDYGINIAAEVNQNTSIPKFLVHTFVENSVKHGLRPLKTKGELGIDVKQVGDEIHIEISDNGIGREEASKHSHLSTGKGLKILDEVIDYFRKERKLDISYEIHDIIATNGLVAGTEVLLKIPKARKEI